MTILVAGARGVTGAAVVAQLVAAGLPVRAMSRSAEGAEALRAPGVEAVVAAYDDPDALGSALDGVSAAYVVTPAAPDMAATEGAFAQAAADAGAHLVKLSAVGAATDSPLRFGRVHAEAEAAIEAVGGTWTFVQPNGFMQNDLAWAAQLAGGTVAVPVADAAWAIVDVRDVAAAAVAALVDPDVRAGERIVVTGPEARTPRNRVASLAAALGRELRVVDVPIAAAQERMLGFGLAPWTVDGLGELFTLYADGGAVGVSKDAEQVTGRRPATWEQFVAAHRAAFGA